MLGSGEKVNILVLDTEVYSNTGGQKSKSTPMGAVAKFCAAGNRRNKKDLGMLAMSYQDVYVASVSLANLSHLIRSMIEAEAYPGTSIVLAYSPCINHGTPMKNLVAHEKAAVDCGYWTLYRYNPSLYTQGQNPFQLDSRTVKGELLNFLKTEDRYESLMRKDPDLAKHLQSGLKQFNQDRFKNFKVKALQGPDFLDQFERLKAGLKEEVTKRMLILYGSETGTLRLHFFLSSCSFPTSRV